jgi:ABC-type transporter Mla MlaB component
VGIFSLFGKKDGQQGTGPATAEATRKKARNMSAPGTITPGTNTKLAPDTSLQAVKRKVVAQATVLKIDEIESAMSSEFVKYASSGNTLPGEPAKTATPPQPRAPARHPVAVEPAKPATPAMGSTTQFLLSDETMANRSAISESETAPVIEEAAILYSNSQIDIAEHILSAAITEETLGDAGQMAWHMLFDLYIVSGKPEAFETLSIDYASKFETSPPTWIDIGDTSHPAPATGSRATPAVAFSGKLDSNIIKQLERVKNLAANNAALRLEFTRVAEVDPVGCGLLLNVLSKLQNSGNDLILVGSLELANKIRAILQVGRRDETEAPWLLLMEILRLLNLEKEFEETSIDYCITFEVSPPAFVAPKNKVTTAAADEMAIIEDPQHFPMPAVIEGKTDILIMSIAKYAETHKPAILDCARLKRVDFGAAGHLLTGLAPLTVKGAVIELHNVNHLVIALFNVIGLKDLVRILPRKA